MKHAPAIVCLLAVVLGAVSAAVTTTLLVDENSRDPGEAPALGTPSTSARPDEGLRDRILELASENRALRERLDALELRAAPQARVPIGEYAAEADLAALRDEVHQWMAGSDVVASEPPELKELVGEALTSIRKDEAIAKVEKKQAAKAAALDERIAKVAGWLELDAFQVDEMRAIVMDMDARDEELIRMWREGVDDETLAKAKQDNSNDFFAAAGRVLTPQQFDTLVAKIGRGVKGE